MLSLEPRDQLVFEGPFNQSVSKNLVIKNLNKKQSVAFKLKTTTPHMFFVRPNVGVLGPDQTVTVNIIMQPALPDDSLKRHKFLVMAAVAPGNDVNLQEFWKEQKSSDIWDAKIKCEIVPEKALDKASDKASDKTSNKASNKASSKVSNKESDEQPRRAVGGGVTDSPCKQDDDVAAAKLIKKQEEERLALKEEIDVLQIQERRPKQRGKNWAKFACCVFTIIVAIVGAYYGKYYL